MMKFSLLLGLGFIFSTSLSWAQSSTIERQKEIIQQEKKVSITRENTVELFSEDKKSEETKEPTLEELKEKAVKGDIEAQLDLGYMYLYGTNGTNTDYKLAFHYYELAAAQNNSVALNNLGSLYFNGIGTEVNYPKAIQYFEDAAKSGSDEAAVNLAIIYLGEKNENGVEKDLDKVFKLLEQARKNNVVAKYLIGYSHYVGFYYKQNYKRAFHFIKEAADAGYDEAQFVLSDLYSLGLGTTKNFSRAVENLRQAVTQGSPQAIIRLADILSEGTIYTKNINEAHVLYNIASVMGNNGAAEKRDLIENNLDIESLLAVQAEAENYKAKPTELTVFIRKTFGNSLKKYIDSNINNVISANAEK